MKKRDFLKTFGTAAIGAPFLSFNSNSVYETVDYSDRKNLKEKEFWKKIREDYTLNDYINLENGYYCIVPNPTLNNFISHVKRINIEGTYYMRHSRDKDNRRIEKRLANYLNCDAEELVVTRNTTESLDLIVGGFPWEKGDEAIYAKQDYGAMQDMFKLVAKRYGVVNKIISVPNHPKSDEEIVKLYEDQITSKTKLIMVCHMINITGQILPIRKICDMAHSYGVEVMVDGAHCVGHFKVDISKLNCDYYGSSLHKWLSTPLGVGILYVSKNKISKINPLLASHIHEEDNILRLNHIGTHPVYNDLAIDNALDYQEMIGMERKENRLRYIQRYWSERLRDVKNIVINTPVEEHRSCAIANVGVKNIDPNELTKILFEKYNIFTVGINYANVVGCRISPNIYTTEEELEHFISSMKEIAA